MEPGYGGFADLGAILGGGGGQIREDAYLGAMGKRASLDSKLAGADMDRKKAIALDGFRRKAIDAGMDPIVIEATIGGIGSDYAGSQLGARRGIENDLLGGLASAFKAGAPMDPGRTNIGLSLVQGVPMTTAQSTNAGIINPKGNPDQTPTPTDLSRNFAGTQQALIGQRNASAALTGDKQANPEKYRAPPKAKSGKPKPTAGAIAFLKKNPGKKKDFDAKYGAGSASQYLSE